MHKHILILESNRNEIVKFEELLLKVNNEIGLTPEKFINLQIASSEALINAIVHGNKEDKNKKVYTEIVHDETNLMIVIKDEGSGFNVDNVPDPTKNENILKESGRGIFIIKSLVDDCQCNSTDKGTEFILKVKK